MGRAPCCDKANVKKGPWSPEEDAKLKQYIDKYGTGGNWIALPQKVGLRRCGKSCRLRWLNYLRPNIKHGEFSDEEDRIIINLFVNIGSRWSIIAAQLPGRTDNDIKNYWNTKLKKKLMGIIDQPSQRKPHLSTNNNISSLSSSSSSSSATYPSSSPLPSNSSCGSHYSSQAAASGGGPFTTTSTFEPFSAFSTISTFSSNTSTCTNSNGGGGSFLQHQVSSQESLLSQMQQQHCSSGGLIMFGNQASCGSSNNNYHIDGVICNQESQKSMISSNGGFVNNGWEKLSHDQASSFLEYGTLGEIGLEEIKQLISSTSASCNNINNNNNNFLFDENKTEERVLYYY